MYTSIRFATLQLHTGNDADHNTLSKTIAVYEKDFFVFNEKELLPNASISREIRKIIYKNSRKYKEQYGESLSQFIWHLN